jgi:hypothetical protein
MNAPLTYEEVAVFYSATPSVQLVPGLLAPGEAYFALIEAYDQPAVSFDRNPERFSIPENTSTTVTEPFTP